MYYDTFRNRKGWTPLIPQNVQAYAAIRVDVWMIDAGGEIDFGWFERIIGGEVDSQEEYAARVRAIALFILLVKSPKREGTIRDTTMRRSTYRSHDSSLPVKLYR